MRSRAARPLLSATGTLIFMATWVACSGPPAENTLGTSKLAVRNGLAADGDDPGGNIPVLLNLPNSVVCTAIMITERWVGTAAHCVDDLASGATISIGYTQPTGTPSWVYLNGTVSRVLLHRNYKRGDRVAQLAYNDFALVELSSAVNTCQGGPWCFLQYDRPMNAQIKINGERQPGSWQLLGYGGTNERGSGLGTLRRDPKMDNDGNKTRHGGRRLKSRWKKSAAKACGGDSGGPVMFAATPAYWLVSGLISGGRDCTKLLGKHYSMGFNREKTDWIKRVIEDNSDARCARKVIDRHQYLHCDNGDIY